MNYSSKLIPRLARPQSRRLFSLTSSVRCQPAPHPQCLQSRNFAQKCSYTSDSREVSQLPPTVIAPPKKKIIVAVTGATGAILGIKILKTLSRLGVETHLIHETDFKTQDIRAMADFSYAIKEQSAPISSGSFRHDGMIVVPCSMKTLAGIRTGYCDDLITRAADVTLKERRNLRPLSDIHLENMLGLSRSGAIIFPPVPAFYTKPESLADVEDQTVGRILDMFDLDSKDFERWDGFNWKK
ncbi:flavoprotein [Lipomyces starkeyi]